MVRVAGASADARGLTGSDLLQPGELAGGWGGRQCGAC